MLFESVLCTLTIRISVKNEPVTAEADAPVFVLAAFIYLLSRHIGIPLYLLQQLQTRFLMRIFRLVLGQCIQISFGTVCFGTVYSD